MKWMNRKEKIQAWSTVGRASRDALLSFQDIVRQVRETVSFPDLSGGLQSVSAIAAVSAL